MTDREFAYKKLSENTIISGSLSFIFEQPNGYSLCDFSILENYIGRFSSRYLINENEHKIIIRIFSKSGGKILKLITNKGKKNIFVGDNFLEIQIDDFLYLLSNDLWVVVEI